MRSHHRIARTAALAALIALLLPGPGAARQQGSSADERERARAEALARARERARADIDRAARLYVSNRHEDHSTDVDFERAIAGKRRTDSIYDVVTRGVVDYRKITYRSKVGDLDVPAYVYQPLEKRGPRGHAALIMVHGGVHGNWGESSWPWVRDAIERGYVVIAPDYRGSTGYGKAHHDAIDYGGYEVDDVMTAYDWLVQNLPHVDPERVAIMGWSHGGYISLLAAARENQPFKATVGIVPVTNLIFRLSFKGPSYQHSFSTQQRIGGLPFEEREIYKARSPFYQVDRIRVPILVHVATNDTDVNFEEAEMLIHKLRSVKPELAETKIYVDPPGGHGFSRRVNPRTLEPEHTPEQRDSWNRVWAFLEWSLRPYEDPSKPPASGR
jgi:dipeptidyl aminopeptidase/acylaminoacyl peptidase